MCVFASECSPDAAGRPQSLRVRLLFGRCRRFFVDVVVLANCKNTAPMKPAHENQFVVSRSSITHMRRFRTQRPHHKHINRHNACASARARSVWVSSFVANCKNRLRHERIHAIVPCTILMIITPKLLYSSHPLWFIRATATQRIHSIQMGSLKLPREFYVYALQRRVRVCA